MGDSSKDTGQLRDEVPVVLEQLNKEVLIETTPEEILAAIS